MATNRRCSVVRPKGAPKSVQGRGPSVRRGPAEIAERKAAAKAARQAVQSSAAAVPASVRVVCVDAHRAKGSKAWDLHKHPAQRGMPVVDSTVRMSEKSLTAWFAERGWAVVRQNADDSGKTLRFAAVTEKATVLVMPVA